MERSQEKGGTNSDPDDGLRPGIPRRTRTAAHAVGHKPVYGVTGRIRPGRHSRRTDGEIQIHAGLFGRGSGTVHHSAGYRRTGEGDQGPAHRTGRRTGDGERKKQGGGEVGYAGMCTGGYADRVCGENACY